MINKLLLFMFTFLITVFVIVGYFKLTQQISTINIPSLPSVSFSDLVKFTRFSLEKAPSQSLVGKIISMVGEVQYESRLATESARIYSPQEVQQGESLLTGIDGSLILNYKDVAEINLENDSGVKIIQTLPADLVFAQTIGSIEYKKIGQTPLSIRVGHMLVENNGDVKISFTSDSPITTIALINGTATVAYNDLYNISRVVDVSAGQVLRFNEGNRQAVLE